MRLRLISWQGGRDDVIPQIYVYFFAMSPLLFGAGGGDGELHLSETTLDPLTTDRCVGNDGQKGGGEWWRT